MASDTSMFTHGITFGGHPVSAAVALANLDIFEREDLCGHVRAKEGEFRAMLERLLRDLPIVGDVRGAGFFHAIELVKDKETKESFDDEESEELLRGFLSGELYRRGLICRADDRGDPVIQLSPPLIADTEQFEEIEGILRGRADRGLGASGPPLSGGARKRGEPSSVLTVRGLVEEMGLELAAGEDAADAPVRWVHITELPDPTPWLSGRRAAADDRHPARHRAAPARVRAPAGRPPPRRPRLRHRLRPRRAAGAAGRRGARARLPRLRGAVRAAVHRAHREGVHAPGQRAVRGAAARHRDPQAARAAGARGARARRGGARAGGRDRRRGDGARRRAARRSPAQAVPPSAARGGARRGARRGRAAHRRARGDDRRRPARARSSRPTTPSSRAARWCCRSRSAAAAGRAPGWWPRATPAASATSSG